MNIRTSLPCAALVAAAALSQVALADDPATAPAQGAAQSKPAEVPGDAADLGGVATKNVVRSSQFDAAGTTTYDSLRTVAGVETSDAKAGAYSDDLYIRGVHLLTTSSYRLDGGFAAVNIVNLNYDKERVEVLKGANALMYGITSPGGIVNLVMKRPLAEPYEAMSVSGSSFGQTIGTLDVSRRYGADGQLGIRINAAGGHVQSFTTGTGGPKGLFGMAVDWNPDSRLALKFDYELFDQDVVQQAVLALPTAVKNTITLPDITRYDPTVLRSGPWSKNQTNGQNFLLSLNYKIGDGWSVLEEAGYSDVYRTRILSQIAKYNISTGAGTITTTETPKTTNTNTYLKLQFEKTASFGPVDNDLVFGVNRNARDVNNPNTTQSTAKQNIYNPVTVAAPPPFGPLVYKPQNTNDTGYYFSDLVSAWERLHVVAGARYLEYDGNYTQTNGTDFIKKSYVWSPSAGIIFDLLPQASLYASYMKSLAETGAAPLGAANYPDVLPPASSTQKEVGIRTNRYHGVTASLGYFDFIEADTVLDPVTNIFGIDGNTDLKGLETSIRIDPYRSWSITGAGLYFTSAQQKSPDPTINGFVPENTARLAGNIFATWRPWFVEGLALSGGVSYDGRKFVDPQDQGTLPSRKVVDLDASYVTRLNGHKAVFSFGVNNVLDDRYWSNAAEGALGIGSPRVFKASMKTEF